MLLYLAETARTELTKKKKKKNIVIMSKSQQVQQEVDEVVGIMQGIPFLTIYTDTKPRHC